MAYTRPPTLTTGDYWSARQHNKYIKDNFAENIPGKIAAKGDLVVASGADAGDVLTVGSNNTVLLSNPYNALKMVWGGSRISLVGLTSDLNMSTVTGNYEGFIEWDDTVIDDWVWRTERVWTVKFGDYGLVGFQLKIKDILYDTTPEYNWQLDAYIQEAHESSGGSFSTNGLGATKPYESGIHVGELANSAVDEKTFSMLQYRKKTSYPSAVARITSAIFPMTWTLDMDYSFFFAIGMDGT